MSHLQRLLEAAAALLQRRRRSGLNKTAQQLQWIWVIDFNGFGWSDQSPQSSLLTAKLMAHYPERLHMVVLLNSPWVFSATWKLCRRVLDARVEAKIQFHTGGQGTLAAKLAPVWCVCVFVSLCLCVRACVRAFGRCN